MPVFEWDEAKRESNLRKHGVDFVRAARLFDGPLLSRPDTRRAYGEDRYLVIGQVDELILAVVITTRAETLRVISARKANRREQVAYRAIRPAQAQGPD
jgi:uncharacterized DUF497 family protein